MKLLSAAQLQEWDAYTIANTPIASIDLMEIAAKACTQWILKQPFLKQPIYIFCGKGNNGGDGLAIARLLHEAGFTPKVFIAEFGKPGTDNFQENLHRLHVLGIPIQYISSENLLPPIPDESIVIDALLGVGLNKPLSGLYALIAAHINTVNAIVIAIDVPTGMYIDQHTESTNIVKANYTLTIQCAKLCFLIPENAAFFGQVQILDIGLHPAYLSTIDTNLQLTELEDIQQCIHTRDTFSHKGQFGHALIIAGSEEKMGAAIMATGAALRSGTGLVTAQIPQSGATALNICYPEAMLLLRSNIIDNLNHYTAIGIGPGLGVNDASQQILFNLISHFKQPMVIDADALSILAENTEWLGLLPNESILTPHPKEFDRVFGKCANDFERLHKALALTQQYPLTIVLKGHHTLIAHQGKGFFNTTGNAGLAKGGSGDVLTGIITALLAQKYEPCIAARLGVYLHGTAADLALETEAEESLIATQVIAYLGKAWNYVKPSVAFIH
ncbi:NAD(P)H-hydrate dehydratase [Hydrotalea sp.]|uniref:NAD(P)H-hydrate dehydratase n=1 Tax=Hydrotalea sp. TaxID=2881279 RepID=UPI003D146C66